MDKDIKDILKKLEDIEQTSKSAYQKIMEGYAEQDKEREAKEVKELEAYLGKSIDGLDPIELGLLKSEMIRDKQSMARDELASNLAELNAERAKPVNWLNKEIK